MLPRHSSFNSNLLFFLFFHNYPLSLRPIHHHHHHQIALTVQIPPLSLFLSPSIPIIYRSRATYIQCPHRAYMNKFLIVKPTLPRLCVGPHRWTSLMSSSMLLHQCVTCLVRLIWIIPCRQWLCHLHWYSNTWNHLNCAQTNDLYKVELLVLNSNTWKHLTVSKKWLIFNSFISVASI